MIAPGISDLILARLSESDRVLDVGGGRHPWFRADAIIDRRTYRERVGATAFGSALGGGRESRERFSEQSWVSRDFYDLPWPFEDKSFDFALCMGTLEDLRDPLPIAREIQRVARSGYISTPTRAAESFRGLSEHPASNQLHGYFHHRWWVEIEPRSNAPHAPRELVFRMKTPLLYQHPQWLTREMGQHTLNYFWENELPCREDYLAQHDSALTDLTRFHAQHEAWLVRAAADPTDAEEQYNHWPSHWGKRPCFRDITFDHAVRARAA